MRSEEKRNNRPRIRIPSLKMEETYIRLNTIKHQQTTVDQPNIGYMINNQDHQVIT